MAGDILGKQNLGYLAQLEKVAKAE
ncbi:hypothetical protein CCACVL1_08652 [Corchorus capsularis]|uniref:Uncharacterized protein n=1 Tax=Corchorus capsularis TaxID=210143 RepID=A0A1R3IZB1_COCAP|nr:hypothetical protein CCACVL1_08652 [Corchorus capsularis]